MAYIDDRRLMIKIAKMYYKEGETQSTIANKIGVSRSLISKYLSKSRESGIVEIIIHDDEYYTVSELEIKLEKIYGIREALCIPDIEGTNSKSRLAVAAANYLLRMVKDGQVIGVSSGTTLHEIAKTLSSPIYYPNICFVPLVGGMGNEREDIHSNSIVANLAKSLHAKQHFLHAPVIVDTKEAKEVIINQSSIKETLELGTKAEIAIVGIGGTPEYSTMVKSYISSHLMEDVSFDGIVGDICYNFIDENGEIVENLWNERNISINLNCLKEIPLVIGVASGKEKVKAIKAALNGKLIDVLITDELTAKLLV